MACRRPKNTLWMRRSIVGSPGAACPPTGPVEFGASNSAKSMNGSAPDHQKGRRRGHAPERSVSWIHLQRSVAEAHHIECSQSGIVADESMKPIERVPVHRRLCPPPSGSPRLPDSVFSPNGPISTQLSWSCGGLRLRRMGAWPRFVSTRFVSRSRLYGDRAGIDI